MSINKNGRKIKDRIYNGRFIARVYKNARLVYQRNAVPSQKFTKLIFDKSISDPKNITGYGEGAIVDIIAKIRRCLCKTVSSWKTTIENPQLLNWEEFGDDPSPFGWRLPTSAEFIALDAAYRGSWTTVNSIYGRRLGANIGPFFPAAGSRNISGTANYRDASGFYWSSTPLNSTYGYYLYLSSSGVYPASNFNYSGGLPIRCVRDTSTTSYAPCPAGETRVGNLIWANSNLYGNKTFCQNETDYGCYFQWGQNTVISSDPNITVAQLVHTKICYLDNYDSNNFPNQWKSSIGDTTWTTKDPSPKGWRVPTNDELIALDTAYRGAWTTINGVNGRYFGSSSGPFLPAAGDRSTDGAVYNQGTSGSYWSSTPYSSSAYYLNLNNTSVYPSNYNYRSLGMAVRCVRDISTIDYMLCPAGEVQIGNIIWAKSNLKAAGEFCEKETDYGCYFQWGQNTAISSDPNVPVTTVTPVLTGNDGDVMVYKPAFWYKYVPDPLGTGNSFGYDISEEYIKDGIYDPENLIAAYKSNNISLRLYSRSGGPPTFNINQMNSIDYAKRRGIGYNIIDFNQHSMIALLFYAKYGNRNSQAILGTGGATSTANKGSTNSLGNRDTINTTTGHTSFAGIEGVHGCAYEWVSGVNINNRVWTVANFDGTTRVIGTAPSSSSYITEIVAANGPYFDLMPITASGGSSSIYYTDYYSQNTGSCVLARSYNDTYMSGGVSYTRANSGSSSTYTDTATRLSYRGTIIEEPDPVAFKALPLI